VEDFQKTIQRTVGLEYLEDFQKKLRTVRSGYLKSFRIQHKSNFDTRRDTCGGGLVRFLIPAPISGTNLRSCLSFGGSSSIHQAFSFASTKRLRKAPAEDVEQAEILTGMTILVKWNHGMRPKTNLFLLQYAMRKQPNCNNSHDVFRDRWN
jgi:hypothetical protein